MQPNRYVDFEIGRSDTVSGAPPPMVASGLLMVLHKPFVQYPTRYAVALPGWGDCRGDEHGFPWSVLRVFADDLEALDLLVSQVSSHHIVRDYTRIGFPRQVPTGFSGPWVEYRRFRVSSRKAGVDALRQRRLNSSIENGLPFFKIRSSSTGQTFVLAVEPRPFESPLENQDVKPDNYGLSVHTRAFALPHIPVT